LKVRNGQFVNHRQSPVTLDARETISSNRETNTRKEKELSGQGSHEDASAEGVEEAARRREELNSGKVRPLRSDEFWASIERLRATWK